MHKELTEPHQQHLDYIESNFDNLRDRAIDDLTHYTRRWAIYTIDFLNSVAEIQGSSQRVDEHVVSLVRNDRKRIGEPRVEILLGEAKSAGSMEIEEVIRLISAECSKIKPARQEKYKKLF